MGADGLSLLDAVDKQLGLKIAPGQAELPSLVVDRVAEKPSANLPGVTEKFPPLRLEFDVADIKLSEQAAPTAPKFTAGGRMEVKGVALIALIQHAWGLDTYDNDLIVGAPKWLATERFDILAKATPPAGPASLLIDDDSLRTMLRNLMTDRFKLALHMEDQPVNVFVLRGDKLKMKPADASERSRCTESAAPSGVSGMPQRMIVCTNTTPAQFAGRLHVIAPQYANRPVVDATGVDGAFDFSVTYSSARAWCQAAIHRGRWRGGAQSRGTEWRGDAFRGAGEADRHEGCYGEATDAGAGDRSRGTAADGELISTSRIGEHSAGSTMRNLTSGALAIVVSIAAIHTIAQTPTEQPDKYKWLEDVNGARSMAWVKTENERSAKILEADPHYPVLEAAELKVLESPDRLPIPSINGDDVYNTWQDAEHVRGILRRTSASDYLTAQPHWQTLLDYDALGKQDKENWVQKGRECLYPGNEICMVSLSAGGEDAVTFREFNLKTGKFVEGGFVLPKSKQDVAWVDKDTLLVSRDWGPDTMTKSGYPFIAKLWKRGQALDQAKEVFRGSATDMGVFPAVLNDDQGHQANFVLRYPNFFESEVLLLTADGAKLVALPLKIGLESLLDDQVIVSLNEDWKPTSGAASTKYVQGSVVSLDLEAVKKDPLHLSPRVVFAANRRPEFEQAVATTRNHLLVSTLDNVQGRAYSYTFNSGAEAQSAWTRKKLNVPDNLTVSIVSTNWSDDRFFLSLTGFLTPSSVLLGDAGTDVLKEAKSLPPQFDASSDVVEQLRTTSKDGTKVPLLRGAPEADIRYDGTNPTLLTAYGGFQVSGRDASHYSSTVGKLWLERGGVYVLANIRGGGEFGPAWHEAGLKTHRQRIYDDFAAVGKDLVTRRITSPRRLGIEGGSNGGLLMGVEMTQHPEMWNAVVIEVPLLDMLGFEHIAAGASWVGEYGSVSVPDQRAFLASISPYNQLRKDVKYPEPFIFTTTKDDRVGPVHARKFAAKMEEFDKPFYYEGDRS